jgi:gluconolactonase
LKAVDGQHPRFPTLARHPAIIGVDAVRQIWMGVDHAEGVAVDDSGQIWAGGEEGQVYCGRPDGDPRVVAVLRGRTLGIAVDGDGSAYVADPDGPGMYRVSAAGPPVVLSRGSSDREAVYPNHPVFLPDRELIWTDSGHWGADDGCIFSTDAAGGTTVVDRRACHFPNGVAVSPDGTTLVVVESNLPGVSAFAIDGLELHEYRVVVECPGTVPDGVAFDTNGGLLISFWAPDMILVLRADGKLETLVYDPLRFVLNHPTNVAFVPGTSLVVAANFGERFLSTFEHDCEGAALWRPLEWGR